MDLIGTLLYLIALFSMAELSHQNLISELRSAISPPKATAPPKLDLVNTTATSDVAAIGTNATSPECYPELGCFGTSSPWFSVLRPFPAPMKPKDINTSLYLFTRKNNASYRIPLWPTINLDKSDYDPKKASVFIVHGFASNTSNDWMHNMKDAYLEDMDANVFLVDWGPGAKLINYLQAAANTRVVGAELWRFGKHIVNNGQSASKIHATGHSLGAHTCGYFGKRMVADNATLGRITALDPAQPGFELEADEVKLTENDADFVDALHTDAKPFIPLFGFGMLRPVGDVDFYINGGAEQPGCYTVEVPENITSILQLAAIPVETLSKWVSCSHGRSYEYFTWSLKNQDCLFVGRKMSTVENAVKIGSVGTLKLADPVISSVRSCTKENCNVIGMVTRQIPSRGSFAVSTNGEPPYCSKVHLNWDPLADDTDETYIDQLFQALENNA